MLLAVARDKPTQIPDGKGEVRTRPDHQVHKTADGFAVGQRVVALVGIDQLQAHLQRLSDRVALRHPKLLQHLRRALALQQLEGA